MSCLESQKAVYLNPRRCQYLTGQWLTLPSLSLTFKLKMILLSATAMPLMADVGMSSSTEFLLILGAIFFLTLFFGMLIWNRSQTLKAQHRTQELLVQLTESNAQTQDLRSQLDKRLLLEESLLKRSNLKRVIASLSSDFVRLTPEEVDDGIHRALRQMGEFAEVDRAYVFILRPDGRIVDNAFEWCAEGVASYKEQLQGISLDDDVPWLGEQLRDLREVHVPVVAKEADPAERERIRFQLQGIRSMFCVPMASDHRLCGFLGFDSAQDRKDWSADIVQLLRIVGEIFTNALERKRIEGSLRDSEERFRELTDLLPQTVFETDQEMWVTYANRHGLETTGYELDDIHLGLNGMALFAEFEHDRLKQRIQAMISGEKSSIGNEFVCVRKDGSQFPAMVYGRAILRADTLIGFRGILVDITEHREAEETRRRLESQFLQAQKFESLSVMAGAIAHNFNNLLTAVLGNLELVLTDAQSDHPWLEPIREADRAARRATELSTLMLTYVGKHRTNKERLDLSALVRDMGEIIELSVSGKVEICCHYGEDACHVEGDAAQLRQILINLVNNANEAISDQGGVIHLRTGKVFLAEEMSASLPHQQLEAGDYVFLEVEDTGIGMAEETLVRIFDPFYTTKFTGRGLGLAAVLGVVRAHRGGIFLESAEGKGTSIRILLPFYEGKGLADNQPPSALGESVPASGTILLVDDEALVLNVGQRMLQRLGFETRVATGGLEAVAMFRQHHMELTGVLLDLTMPGMDGRETFAELQRIHPGFPVVIASGYPEEQISQRFEGQMPSAFIRKPYQLTDLSEKLMAFAKDD